MPATNGIKTIVRMCEERIGNKMLPEGETILRFVLNPEGVALNDVAKMGETYLKAFLSDKKQRLTAELETLNASLNG